jgi:group II intron reverse transcriptase/maturase
MRTTQAILEMVHNRGENGLPLKRVYRLLYNRNLYVTAYGNLYSNKGALTPGTDPNDTIQGMSLDRIDQLIQKLKDRTYQWQPVRRKGIPKKNDQIRWLGLPGWTDKLLQEVIRLILEAYYEPQFSPHAHGFRPGRGCHTALQEISQWSGTRWYVEGDIQRCFDSINTKVLLQIIERNIPDKSFLKLLRKMLQAGYMQEWQYHRTFSGVPQGGVVSPILSNIFLNDLDQFIEKELMPSHNRGQAKRINPEYNCLKTAVHDAKRKGNVAQYKTLKRQMQHLPSQITHDPQFRRLKYVRYGDDFLLGYIGTRAEASEIKHQISHFLHSIKLTLSDEKTLITNAVKNKARFLGYEIHIAQEDSRMNRKTRHHQLKRRTINGQPLLHVPKDVVKEWNNRFSQQSQTSHRPELLACSDYEITLTYSLEFQGLVNYYALAYDVSKLYQVKYHFETSLIKTLATKHQRSNQWVIKKYKRPTQTGSKAIIVSVSHPNHPDKSLTAKFGDKPIRQKKETIIIDNKPHFHHGRNELVGRLLANKCELCGSSDQIRGHHVHKLADVKKRFQGHSQPPPWAAFMMARHRKVVFVCHTCHTCIHTGKYDGPKVN